MDLWFRWRECRCCGETTLLSVSSASGDIPICHECFEPALEQRERFREECLENDEEDCPEVDWGGLEVTLPGGENLAGALERLGYAHYRRAFTGDGAGNLLETRTYCLHKRDP